MTLDELFDYIDIDENQPYAVKEYNSFTDGTRIVFDSLCDTNDYVLRHREIETMYVEKIDGILYIVFEYMVAD